MHSIHNFILTVRFTAACILLCACTSLPAHAQLLFTLSPSGPFTTSPGHQISITGTIANIGTQEIDLVGGGATLTGPNPSALFLDDTLFLTNLPLSLVGGAQYTGDLVLQIGPSADFGSYTSAYTVQGEGSTGTLNAGVPYSTGASIAVNVVPQAPAVPEPGPFTLVGVGMSMAIVRLRRHYKRVCSVSIG